MSMATSQAISPTIWRSLQLNTFWDKKRMAEITCVPILIDFSKLMASAEITFINEVHKSDWLYASIALFGSSLRAMDSDELHGIVVKKSVKTLILIKQQDHQVVKTGDTGKRDPSDKSQRSLQPESNDSILLDANRELNISNEEETSISTDKDVKASDKLKCSHVALKDEDLGEFDEIFSDSCEEESSSDSESGDEYQEDFACKFKEFVERVRQRRRTNAIGSRNVENLLIGAVTFDRSYSLPDEVVCHLLLTAVRRKYRNCSIGKFLINKLKDSSFTGPYDVLLTYADDNATGFFKKIGFTDDPVLACKYRKISDNWLNSTPMCFIPHFSSSFYPVFMDDKDSIDKQIEAVEQYIDKWRIQQTGAYQHQMHCILKATRQLKLLKETVEQQEKIIKRLKTENLKLRQAPDDQLDFTTTKEKNKNIIKWEFCQQLLVEDSIVDVDVIRITKASLCREYFDLKLATLSDPLMFDDLYYCGGKSKTELERILQYGFSQDDINNSDLRKGLGFTQNPRNAMEFTIPGTILLCTIGLGNTKTVVTDTHFRSFPPDGFDSILTTGKQLGHDCEHPSSHYIIFDAAQALPVCLIDYNVTWLD